MKTPTTMTIPALAGAAALVLSSATFATEVDVTGSVDASGFQLVPGFASGVDGPTQTVNGDYGFSYDDADAPANGELTVPVESLNLTIGDASYGPADTQAVLFFADGALDGFLVGAIANGGPQVLDDLTDDFFFSRVGDTSAFRYTTVAETGVFEVLSTPDFPDGIGTIAIDFDTTTTVPTASTLGLLGLGLPLALFARRRRR